MPLDRIVAIVFVVLSTMLVVRTGPTAIKSWRIYAGTGRRRQQDAQGRAPAAPSGILDRQTLLAAEGYRPIGVTSLQLPVGERFAWILAAEDADSYAILAGGTAGVPLTGIYSAWEDGTWLCTLHPIGSPSDRPNLQVRVVPTTLADAAAVHRSGLERLRGVHGDPRPIRSMPDMLALDVDYRVRFGGSRLRALTFRLMLPAILAGILLILSLGLLVASFR